jgi:hypothetical protein
MKIIDGDFTSADFRHAKFEDCHFKNCVFDAASLADASIFRGSFYESRFRRTDLRVARLGYGGTIVNKCVFEKPKLARSDFSNMIFEKCDFLAKDWKNVSFRSSGFWGCRFVGLLENVSFLGRHPLGKLVEDRDGPPQRVGLHGVDFSESELLFCSLRSRCPINNIILPDSGSLIICKSSEFIKYCDRALFDGRQQQILDFYFAIYKKIILDQDIIFISRNDLVRGYGLSRDRSENEQVGLSLFELFRQEFGC